ncbi:MAG TPA: FkbM family methyltransferase [Terracidiphilus sp.]|jgi:FkbM family methyltransferase
MDKLNWYNSLRNRLKSSSIRRIYRMIFNREVFLSTEREEEFYRNFLVGLKPGDIIFDVGANEGAKTDIFLRLSANVVALEPDDACLNTLRDRFLRYRWRAKDVSLVGKAVSDKSGKEEMWIDGPGSAVNTMSRKWADHLKDHKDSFPHGHCGLEFRQSKSVETTSIRDLIKLYGSPFFIKIDVEGHELSVLRGMPHPVPFLSFEVNLSTLRQEGIDCARVLGGLEPDGRFNYTPDCCAGMALPDWLSLDEFCGVLASCPEETIEVFWRTNHGAVQHEVN